MTALIHKHTLDLTPYQSWQPGGYVPQLLAVGLQYGAPQLWYEIDRDAGPAWQTELSMICAGTGTEAPDRLDFTYLGTTIMPALRRGRTEFVWHWYGRVKIL